MIELIESLTGVEVVSTEGILFCIVVGLVAMISGCKIRTSLVKEKYK